MKPTTIFRAAIKAHGEVCQLEERSRKVYPLTMYELALLGKRGRQADKFAAKIISVCKTQQSMIDTYIPRERNENKVFIK